MAATGPWPAYMADYLGGVNVTISGSTFSPVKGITFTGASGAFNADTGMLTVAVSAGAQGATGAAGPTGATGATGPGA